MKLSGHYKNVYGVITILNDEITPRQFRQLSTVAFELLIAVKLRRLLSLLMHGDCLLVCGGEANACLVQSFGQRFLGVSQVSLCQYGKAENMARADHFDGVYVSLHFLCRLRVPLTVIISVVDVDIVIPFIKNATSAASSTLVINRHCRVHVYLCVSILANVQDDSSHVRTC